MGRIRFQECSNCARRSSCSGQCARTPQNAIQSKPTRRLQRLWQGRMLVQKILDIEDTLPPYQKKVAQLYYREGLTQQRIGEILGVTQGSVSRTLARVHARVHRLYHKSLKRMHANLQRAQQGHSCKRRQR